MSIKSVCARTGKPLIEYELGERYCYINDGLRKEGIQYTRSQVPAELAIAMAKTAGYHAEFDRDFGNKDYVCVAKDDDYAGKRRVFAYKHDFTYYIYIVWSESR